MFERLHRQMTLFCAAVTGIILVVMTLLCLFLSEASIRQNHYQSFLNELNSVISYLENQTVISNQWLAKTEDDNRLVLDVYDNGAPLLYNSLAAIQPEREKLVEQAKRQAAEEYGLDISLPVSNSVLSKYTEFSMKGEEGRKYYAAAAVFPKSGGALSAVLVYSLTGQEWQVFLQRLLFFGVDLLGIGGLILFSWIFTGIMLGPLEESRKKQAQFVAAASHELRSPLTVMLSNLSALQKAGPKDRGRFEENIKAEGNRMSRLIDDMLALANADSRSWRITKATEEMDTLILELYEHYQGPARERGIALSVRLPERVLPECVCDGGRIQQALSVLLENALSYTPQGGCVELSVEEKSGRCLISVQDNGPGVPDGEKLRIFDRFYRTDKSHQNKEHFGLGLCVAREIVDLHKGKLWVEDTPGGGATFCMLL